MNQAEHIIPTRARPFEKTGKKTPFWLKSLLGRELAPSRDEYRAVTDALWDGDQPMDDLVTWMFEENPKERRAQIQKAFEGDLTDAPQAVLDFFETLSTPPAWIGKGTAGVAMRQATRLTRVIHQLPRQQRHRVQHLDV